MVTPENAIPTTLLEKLRSIFTALPEIRAAYLVAIYAPGSNAPPSRPIIGIEASGDMESLVESLTAAITSAGLTDTAWYLHFMGDDIVASYMLTTMPFFTRPSKIDRVRMKLEEIEKEMKESGIWQSAPLAPEAYAFTRAFAGDTMAYSQWLQFIFIPRVREVVDGHGDLPPTSSVGAQAVREFDGYDAAAGLANLLAEFDEIIESY